MKYFHQADVIAAALAATIVALGVNLPATAEDHSTYNGYWWSTLSVSERERFLDGLSDCYIYDAHGRHALSPSVVAAQKVSEFYNRRTDQKSTSVLIVFQGLEDKAEWATARHGYFDGDYWRQFGKAEKLAFVRGYLACRAAYLHAPAQRTPEFYESFISHWFGTKDGYPDVNVKTASDKIGDVIDRLAER